MSEEMMKTWWPVLSLLINLGLGVLVTALNQKLQLAIATLKLELREQYATKADLERVEKQVDVANRVDRGFGTLYRMLDKHKITDGMVQR